MTSYIQSLLATFDNIRRAQAENRGVIPDLSERIERLKATRAYAVEHSEELWQRAVCALENNNIRVLFASDEREAREMVMEEVGDERLVVKSKSNVTKHLHLSEYLSSRGVRVVESDIGDRVIQLAGMSASHPTCPAAHLDRYEIAGILSHYLGQEVSPEPEVLTNLLRREISEKIAQANIGITGANAVCASEGSIVLIHNEGNILQIATQTKKHIIVTGADKIYPCVDDAINMVKILTYYGTGQPTTAYVDIISGPSKTADIESTLFSGVHGPEELVLVVVDTLKGAEGIQQAYQCIGCGNCLTVCPVYRSLGNNFAEGSYLGSIGVVKHSACNPTEKLYYCTTCRLCEVHCPLEIPVRSLLLQQRREYLGHQGPLPAHREIIENIRRRGCVFNEAREDPACLRQAEVIYFKGCMAAVRRPEIARAAEQLLQKTGTDYITVDERCCGAPLLKIGCEIQDLIEHNTVVMEQTGAGTLLFTCPGCLDTFKNHYSQKYKYLHISEYILQQMVQQGISIKETPSQTLTYHKPCHLDADAPVDIVKQYLGDVYIPAEDGCCGAGGGVRSAYPHISQAVAQQRRHQLQQTGAELVLTACPFCREHLQSVQQPVEDLVVYLDRMME